MMIDVQTRFFSEKWASAKLDKKSVRLKGSPFSGMERISPANFLAYDVAGMQGFFSFVVEEKEKVIAGVDRVRSMPLFYAIQGKTIWLSDNAEWIKNEIACDDMDGIAKDEFLLTGFVTGADTLYLPIKQVQAGETVSFYMEGGVIVCETARYFQFLHVEPKEYDTKSLERKLEKAVWHVVDRMIAYAEGRQIVIPLSGGYDSRLLAACLKMKGYENVLCFTYGRTDSKEVAYSRRVAKSLDLKWIFVEYTEELWRQYWWSAEAEAYRTFSANCTSLPHMQDWLAVKLMKDQGLIEEDCVFMPGHSGDFVAGSHIPNWIFKKNNFSQEDLLDGLFNDHYDNVPDTFLQYSEKSQFINRIRERIGIDIENNNSSLANAYELWDWQERQAKYIANSVRVYEFYKCDWWLPLWDKEFVELWHDIPLALRRERLWFKQWIASLYLESVGKDPVETPITGNSSDRPLVLRTVIRLSKYFISDRSYKRLAASVKKLMRCVDDSDPIFFYALIDDIEYITYVKNRYSLIGMYSDLYLKERWGKRKTLG